MVMQNLSDHCTINSLNTKRRPLYLKTQFVPRCCAMYYTFKYEGQTALFKDPVRTALLCYVLYL